MTAPQGLAQLFQYKRWANQELLALGAASQGALPADDYRLFVRILNHTYVVDRIFASHLQGLPQTTYQATNTEETPELATLSEAVRASDDWYVQYVGGLDDAQLAEMGVERRELPMRVGFGGGGSEPDVQALGPISTPSGLGLRRTRSRIRSFVGVL